MALAHPAVPLPVAPPDWNNVTESLANSQKTWQQISAELLTWVFLTGFLSVIKLQHQLVPYEPYGTFVWRLLAAVSITVTIMAEDNHIGGLKKRKRMQAHNETDPKRSRQSPRKSVVKLKTVYAFRQARGSDVPILECRVQEAGWLVLKEQPSTGLLLLYQWRCINGGKLKCNALQKAGREWDSPKI
ncbi:hypothetical protein F4860DRAFT_510211 [Xylaria cubensis]|nr:hypothetical protein F4860DRAFT_510211 [Xylaria cubensis]